MSSMDSLLSIFLLFIAGITALLTYMTVPYIPVVTLVSAAAIVLAAGVWWHWTQFAVDYRASTWQEQLRNYAAYVMIGVVIIVSYVFYTFAWTGTPLQAYASQAQNSIRNVTQRATSQVVTGTSRAANAVGNTLFKNMAEPSGY